MLVVLYNREEPSFRLPEHEFKTDEGMAKAYKNLIDNDIDAVVVIGGDGIYGALAFSTI